MRILIVSLGSGFTIWIVACILQTFCQIQKYNILSKKWKLKLGTKLCYSLWIISNETSFWSIVFLCQTCITFNYFYWSRLTLAHSYCRCRVFFCICIYLHVPTHPYKAKAIGYRTSHNKLAVNRCGLQEYHVCSSWYGLDGYAVLGYFFIFNSVWIKVKAIPVTGCGGL
jgi:hypothetical protein